MNQMEETLEERTRVTKTVGPHGHPAGVTGTLLFLVTVGQVLPWKNDLGVEVKIIFGQA